MWQDRSSGSKHRLLSSGYRTQAFAEIQGTNPDYIEQLEQLKRLNCKLPLYYFGL
ncbi:unnamed protein product [Hymenolepis diminuta]|uniref:Uncharacterized protein n=1 Tax=Hymenolepis diminuta TaxID=6216 RepID=A0A564YNJ0_HYMDI|nr:unnamed protein product [Hymenolepis diminuta]